MNTGRGLLACNRHGKQHDDHEAASASAGQTWAKKLMQHVPNMTKVRHKNASVFRLFSHRSHLFKRASLLMLASVI